MFCSNCGRELQDNELFCPNCGTQNANVQQPPNQTANLENPQTAAAYEYQSPAVELQTTPQKKTGKKIAIAVCLVLVLALSSVGILAATGHLSGLFSDSPSDPKEYFQYVAEKNLDSSLSSMNANYAAYVNKLSDTSVSETLTMDVTFGESLQNLLAAAIPEFKALKNASFQATVQSKDQTANVQLKAGVNKKDLLTFNAYMNMEQSEGYLQIPELSNSYIDFSKALTEIDEELEMSGLNYQELTSQMNSMLPDPEAMDRIIKRYSEIIWTNAQDVEKSSDTLKANDVEQKCTVLTATLNGSDLYNVITDMLDSLAKDEDIKDLIEQMDAETYEEFSNEINSTLADLKENKKDITDTDLDLSIVFYVNDDDQIIGEEFKGQLDGEDFQILCHMPQKDEQFGYLFRASFSGTDMFTLEGNGTISDEILNGNFSFSMDEEFNPDSDYVMDTRDMIQFRFSDCDLKSLQEGHLNGTVEISSEAIPAIAQGVLTLTAKSDESNSSLTAKISVNREELITIAITTGKGEKLSDCKPSTSDTVYDITNDADMEKYQQELKLEQFLKDLSDKTGIPFDTKDIEDLLNDSLGTSDNNDFNNDLEDNSDNPFADDWNNSDEPDDDNDSDYTSDDEPDDLLDDFYDEDDIQSEDSSSASTIGKYNTIKDFIESDMMKTQLDSLKSSLSGSGMAIDVTGEGNKLVYSFTYSELTETAGMADALASGVESQANTFKAVAKALKLTVNVENPIVELKYIDANGKIIYSKEFTAD